MDFLCECATRLDEGASADEVLRAMRERFTTTRCLNVKTGLVRRMCRETAEYASAREALLADVTDGEARDAVEVTLRNWERGIRPPRSPPTQTERDAAARVRALPPRYAENVRALRVTRSEIVECKRLGYSRAVEKNRQRRRVSGRQLLAWARGALRDATRVCDLALALMLLTGRRTCEVLNGQSRFEVTGPHALHFTGQAKKRHRERVDDAPGDEKKGFAIPVLGDADEVRRAIERLRAMQGFGVLTNAACTRRYQSLLSRRVACDELLSRCGSVHGLRGAYACMAVRLFDWSDGDDDPTDAYVAMNILGHEGMEESLVYTTFALGDDFASEPSLGKGVPLRRRS